MIQWQAVGRQSFGSILSPRITQHEQKKCTQSSEDTEQVLHDNI